ncbi:MAG: carbohydrate ABC transporter permease [Spirochaetales bacterium]|nr:carbohydrate ABC transporter permease [Spirochaetales bacterium]
MEVVEDIKDKSPRHRGAKIIIYAVLVFGSFWMLLPFVWMILTSLKSLQEAISVPPVWFPSKPLWSNYQKALSVAPFGRYFLNTVIVSSVNTVLTIIVTILAAFSFARLKFVGKNLLFTLILASMMVPGEMLIIQNYVTVAKLGWIDSYAALIVPWIASPFYIFLLRQYFMQIPDQLYYAARVDGCRDFKYLWKVMVPNAKNTIVTIGILNFVASWNAFLWPLLVTNKERMRVLTIGLTEFTNEAGSDVHLQMAAATFIILPMIIVYIILRPYIIEGVSRSGIKG